MNPKNVLRILDELTVLPYFPKDENVMNALVRLMGNMCESEEQVRWLVTRMTSGIYAEWPGPHEMRAAFCYRYKPKDGIAAYSSVYLDGDWPLDPTAPPRIEAPKMLALPAGQEVSADRSIDTAVQLAARFMRLRTRRFDQPVTQAEITTAPEWLRRLEGYE